jgi:hypothetical protein
LIIHRYKITSFTDVLTLASGALATRSCESTGELHGYHDRDHFNHNRCYHEDRYDGNNYRSERPCGWQKSSEVCPFFLKKTADHKDVDSRGPLTENVVSSFGLESRFYAVLSKAASSGLALNQRRSKSREPNRPHPGSSQAEIPREDKLNQ